MRCTSDLSSMAVTRDGIPVRVWCWPGNMADSALIRQVKDDMRDWCLSRVIWVADRGFSSAENRRYLRKAGGHSIIGEKRRSGSPEADAALLRRAATRTSRGTSRSRKSGSPRTSGSSSGFNPEAADRDAAVRARMIAQLTEIIEGSDQLASNKRAELRGVISTKPGLNRYLRVTPGGLLRIDAAKAKAKENLDEKYLLRTSDPKMSAEDIALGYKQLLQVARLVRHEAGHRPAPRLPPERRAHPRPRHPLPARPPPGPRRRERQRDILSALHIDSPPRIYQLQAAVQTPEP
jgi:Transposase DDE domain